MSIEIKHDADEATVVVTGEIEVGNAYDLYLAVVDASDAGARSVVVDLRQVTFLDSVGLGMLVRSRDETLGRSIEFVLDEPSPTVSKLLTVTAMNEHFRIRRAPSSSN